MFTEHERRQSNEQTAAERALKAAADPSLYPLINQLSNCVGAYGVVVESRVLRIVGVHLAQRGLGDLFEDIYAATLEHAMVEPGDGQRFLQAEFRA